MARPAKTSSIQCEYFVWRLFHRDGVWYADGRGSRNSLGKHSLATRNHDEALANLRQLDRVKAVELGVCKAAAAASPVKENERLSIATGWDHFMQRTALSEVAGGASVATQKRYRAVRHKHEAFCIKRGVESWNAVDKSHLQAYGDHLRKKSYADRSLYLELTTLKSVQKHLILEKRLPESLRIHLPLRRPQGTDTYCYSVAQVRAMVAHAEAAGLKWLAEIILFLACTGLRIGELASLRWTDIKHDAAGAPAFISLTDERASGKRKGLGSARRTKGRRSRTIPIFPRLREILPDMERNPDGKLFHGPRGGNLKPDTVRNIFVREVITPLMDQFPTPVGEIGFAHGRVHGLRHYFVSQAFLGGANEGEVKDWVGHRDSRIVEHYRHLAESDSQRKMEALDLMGDRRAADGPQRGS